MKVIYIEGVDKGKRWFNSSVLEKLSLVCVIETHVGVENRDAIEMPSESPWDTFEVVCFVHTLTLSISDILQNKVSS